MNAPCYPKAPGTQVFTLNIGQIDRRLAASYPAVIGERVKSETHENKFQYLIGFTYIQQDKNGLNYSFLLI